MMMMQEINILEELFLSTEIWGYLGPWALVLAGYYIAKEDKYLGVFMFIIDSLVAAQYYMLVEATPAYWWHIIILMFGGIFFCIFPILTRK